jgi:hypothetical protein
MKNLPNWLINNPGFSRKFKALNILSVTKQFPTVNPSCNDCEVDEDISYLLTCGSILAQSENDLCQDAALRIAQFTLQNVQDEVRKDHAALILDSLSNYATLNLAIEKELLKSKFELRMPIAGQVEVTRRKIEHTVEVGFDKDIHVNRFQAEFWNSASENEWVSVSAPTSVGKSFILESWVEDFICKNKKSTVVYLVPTRALITEVSDSLINTIGVKEDINIQTLPLHTSFDPDKTNIFIFTQERLNIFNNSVNGSFKVDLLIVDEAHKIGDSMRGVFLQYVLEMTCARNSKVNVIFASPFTSNPETLLSDAPHKVRTSVVKSTYVTVNQNLIWVEQKPLSSKEWSMYLYLREEKNHIGDFHLKNTPSPVSKRLTFVALALGKHTNGNVVYVNGAADAETAARQLSDGLDEEINDEEVNNLIELSSKVIHERFVLNLTLKKGVAYHYGNMPLIIKSEIERLFTKGKLRYLVCTSTLVEGVNMACKNIFIRGPRKGRNKPMEPDDFWNLAGRAGRWGKEFQGNVICVDTDDKKIWNGEPPVSKRNIKIVRATDGINENLDDIISYINSPHHYGMTRNNPSLQSLFSYLCSSSYLHGGLVDNQFFEKYVINDVESLDYVINEVFDSLDFPLEVIPRNPGISPLLMQSLWERFDERDDEELEGLLLSDPSDRHALESYQAAFTRISATMSTALGHNSKGAYLVALLVVNWMRGFPLARLISSRIERLKKKGESYVESTVIRNVMEDVEKIARYEAPKLLSCYNDLLKHFYLSRNRGDLISRIDDIGVYLELGVSLKTQISLISLGFSRTSAVMISVYITADDYDELACKEWIENNYLMLNDLPALVKFEIYSIFNGIEI